MNARREKLLERDHDILNWLEGYCSYIYFTDKKFTVAGRESDGMPIQVTRKSLRDAVNHLLKRKEKETTK